MINYSLAKNYLLDILFPKYCVNCGQEENNWLCFDCAQTIIPVVSQVCPECEKLSLKGTYHLKCRKDKSLKGILAASYFEEGPIREMIHNFKYNSVTELAGVLAQLMTKVLKDNINLERNDFVLTYVPLHWQRQAKRGYNQAEILTQIIGQNLGVKVESFLIRNRSAQSQVQLRGNARRKSLRGLFTLKAGICVKQKKIIIVDDITTTGSTLNECGYVLKKAGAKEVWGLVVARG